MSGWTKKFDDRTAEERHRQERLALIQRMADDVATWPSSKLRGAYAQPETIRKAEERERLQAQQRDQVRR